MDTADQASRKALENLLHNMLMADHVSHRLVKMVVVRICELKGTSEAMIPYLAETVSEIREPICVVAKDIAAEDYFFDDQLRIDLISWQRKRILGCHQKLKGDKL